jgi:hypothetical protein
VIGKTILKEIDGNEEDHNAVPPGILNAPAPKRRERGDRPKSRTISVDPAVEEAFDEPRELGEQMHKRADGTPAGKMAIHARRRGVQ